MDLLDQIREAGIVGCGGAGFPTHVKYQAQAEYFIVNGAECEPLLRTDRVLMQKNATALIETIEKIGALLSAKKCMIALKKTYAEEIKAISGAIEALGSSVELFLMDNYYPAGDEQMIVREVTGKTVPPGGLPLDVGAVVSNVATVLCVRDAAEGKAFTHRVLTVTGKVKDPIVLRVPVGTPVTQCIEQAGGAPETYTLISGGPMMGRVMNQEEAELAVVTKTTSGLIILPEDHLLSSLRSINVTHTINRARSSCIQCSFCTQLCPRYQSGHPLQPHRIMRKLAFGGSIEGILDDDDAKQALICCECGICEDYACPMLLQPRQVNALLKAAYAKQGIRYPKTTESPLARPEREYRKVPSKKAASRVGVLEYYDTQIDRMIDYEPIRVEIPLRQHIGVPAEAVVKVGDKVKAGQKIGALPEGKMGANIHTGISGVVTKVGERIVIERGSGGA